jgi:ABC-2 type transport system ATP-binding protein
MTEILKIENLNKNFGRKVVLKRFNLTLEEGKVYGLLGKNGTGKTTLMRIIMGVIPADSGEILYKNKRISFNDDSYKREIGFIAEESIFYSWMSIQGQLSFNSSFFPKWNAKKAEHYLTRFSLDGSSRIKTLSRGMKLKLGFVIALASEPEMLILDDPTSGIDVATRYDFIKEIIGELTEAGTTILFSTHMVREIAGIIDHLSILNQGRLILDSDYESLRATIRRVSFMLDDQVKELPQIDGVVAERRTNGRYEIVIYPWNEEKREKIASFRPKQIEIESMDLEDIYLSFESHNL